MTLPSGPSSLVLHPVEHCVFCRFLQGGYPYTIMARNHIVAIMVTREQRGLGHLLVVPIEHRQTILDLTAQEASAVMSWVQLAARAVLDAYQCTGLAIWQNNGAAAHQRVPHVHFHVAGTLPEGGTIFDEVPFLSVEETDAIAERIRPHLSV